MVKVRLGDASPEIQLVLELTQIRKIVEHYSSVQDAIDGWDAKSIP